jgi:hypothetical protein
MKDREGSECAKKTVRYFTTDATDRNGSIVHCRERWHQPKASGFAPFDMLRATQGGQETQNIRIIFTTDSGSNGLISIGGSFGNRV